MIHQSGRPWLTLKTNAVLRNFLVALCNCGTWELVQVTIIKEPTGHRRKLLGCNICSAYLEKFGAECQLNFLLRVTTCCRNFGVEGRGERDIAFFRALWLVVYYIWDIELRVGRFVAVRSMCEHVFVPEGERRVQTTWKKRVKMWKRNTGTNIRLEKTGSCLMSLLIPVSSSTWFEMGDGGSRELLIFHWNSVRFNGAFSG